jgi:hypothetical protein
MNLPEPPAFEPLPVEAYENIPGIIWNTGVGTKGNTTRKTLEGVPQAPASSRPPFAFVKASDMRVNPISWLLEDYLETDALVVFFGLPSAGKSFIALDIACCVATGTSFHGHAVQHGAVFIIAGEGHNGLARRSRAWSQHNGVSIEDADLYFSRGPTDLRDMKNAAWVADAVQRLADETGKTPTLIVIDTLARNFGGDENSAAEIGQFVRSVDSLLRRKWNATVIIVHHSGKNAERGARGSSALKCAVDAEYEVKREEGKVIHLIPRKMKDAEEPPPLAFELATVQFRDSAGNIVSSAALKLTSYTPAKPPDKSGLGKNQQIALGILKRMHKEIADRLAGQGREDHPVLILTTDWRIRCEDEGIPHNRFKEARDSLIDRQIIYLNGPHVHLASETTELIRESEIRTPQHGEYFGQTGHGSDTIRTEIGHITEPSPTTPPKYSGDI